MADMPDDLERLEGIAAQLRHRLASVEERIRRLRRPPLKCPFCEQAHDHCDSPGAIVTGTTGCERVDGPARSRLSALVASTPSPLSTRTAEQE